MLLSPVSGALCSRARLRASKILPLVSLLTLLIQALIVVQATHDSSGQESDQDKLGKLCKRIHEIRRISEMIQLSETLQKVLDSKPSKSSNDKSSTNSDQGNNDESASPLSHLASVARAANPLTLTKTPMTPCLEEAEAIIALSDIIKEEGNVCSSSHIDKIEHYLNFYFNKKTMDTGITDGKRPITTNFFDLYSTQVSFHCKANLIITLQKIENSGLINEEDYVRAFPWLSQKNIDICEELIGKKRKKKYKNKRDSKMIEKASLLAQFLDQKDPIENREEALIEFQKLECEAGQRLSQISNFNELVGAFEMDRQELDAAKLSKPQTEQEIQLQAEENARKQKDKEVVEPVPVNVEPQASRLYMIVSQHPEVVDTMLSSCSRLRPHYERTVLSIIRLIRLGFNAKHTNFDAYCKKEKIIKKWFGITLVCNSMLTSFNDLAKHKKFEERIGISEGMGINSEKNNDDKSQNGDEESIAKANYFEPMEDYLFLKSKYHNTLIQKMTFMFKENFQRMLIYPKIAGCIAQVALSVGVFMSLP